MSESQIQNIGPVFGAVVKDYRAKLAISQEELAHRAGLDRTFVSRIERGVRQPTISSLIRLGQALGVSASELISVVEQRLQELGWNQEGGVKG